MMDTLRQQYRERLVVHLEALKGIGERLMRSDEDAEESLRRLAHRLHGTAGSYGFSDVSLAAAAVENGASAELAPLLEALLTEIRLAMVTTGEMRRRVLIVEDDSDLVSLLRTTVATHADEITVARDGAEARRALAASTPAVIITDLVLPDMDGRQLLAEIAADPLTASVPKFAMSAIQSPGVRAECFALGVLEFFKKPIDPVAVSSAIKAALGAEERTSLEMTGDLLTGLPGADAFRAAANQAREHFGRTGKTWTLSLVQVTELQTLRAIQGDAAANKMSLALVEGLTLAMDGTSRLMRLEDGTLVMVDWGRSAAEVTSVFENALETLGQTRFSGRRGLFNATGNAGVVELGASRPDEAMRLASRMLDLASLSGPGLVVATTEAEDVIRPQILLAEDDPDQAELMMVILEGAGLQVHHRADGISALETALDGGFSLVVLDVQMPGKDGFSLLSELRANAQYAQVPILMVTSLGNERHVVRALELGANDYVVKPYSTAILRARVNALLGRY